MPDGSPTDPMMRDTVAQLLMDLADNDSVGVRTRECSWSWREAIGEGARRAGWLLAERDPHRPFHVGVLLDNVPDFVFWLEACALAGAALIGINNTRRGAELADEAAFADPQFIVTDNAGAELLAGHVVGVEPKRFINIDDAAYAGRLAGYDATPRIAEGVGPETLMFLLFTSGTTGRSKAVRCTQKRQCGLAYANAAKYRLQSDVEVSYCCMPLFHGNALMALWGPSLTVASPICLTPKFSASKFIDDVRFYGATFFTYVGKALGYLLATPEQPDDADNTLVRGFGTEASAEDQATFKRRFDCDLIEGYGSSEGAGHFLRPPDTPLGALGVPANDGVQILDPVTLEQKARARIDNHGRVLNPEEAIGEIANRDAATRFEGYYKNPKADAERVHDGYFWGGDLGYIDEAGYAYFAGRQGDWMRVDSENLSALSVEMIGRRHPDVVMDCAFGVADPRSGDQVMLAIELQPGTEFDPEGFARFLAAQDDLGTKSNPRFIRVSAQLPATGSQKVQKSAVKAVGWACDDPVWWWVGRGAPAYTLMSEADKAGLVRQFVAAGRAQFLPAGAVLPVDPDPGPAKNPAPEEH